MQTLDVLKRKIKSAEDLLSVVQTMKALAAVSIRHAERAVEALSEYNRTIEMGLHIVLRTWDELSLLAEVEPRGSVGLVLLSTDQGLCGQFNERIVTYALDKLNGMHIPHQDRTFLAVGGRGAGMLQEAGQSVEAVLAMPNAVPGLTALVQNLLLTIDEWREKERITEIWLLCNRSTPHAIYEPSMVRLLPVDLAWLQQLKQTRWPSRVLPTFTVEPEPLFAALIRQHLFVTIYQACAESLASEDASRLSSMQTAESNIMERLEELTSQHHHQRQESITAELLDIVAGYEAVMTKPKREA